MIARMLQVQFIVSITCWTLIYKSTGAKDKTIFKRSSQSMIVKRLLDKYSKQDPPMLNRSTEVKLGIHVNSIYSVSEQNMDYAVNLYLRQSWKDPRLAFKSPDGQLTQIKMEEGSWDRLWLPDTFFRNEKRATYHEVTVANRLLRINTTGYVWYATKISATLSCPMQLHNYPLDTQVCPMMLESFGYTTETMTFAWLDKAIDVDKGLQLLQFSLVDKLLRDCSQNYSGGAFPCLEIKFVLDRDIGYFIIQVYIPSILIVILSWVSFWINIDASPARVSLGLLTVLTTTTMSGGARESLPRVSYIKAIDVWMIACLCFVFASLIEYAVVNVVSRRQVKSGVPPSSNCHIDGEKRIVTVRQEQQSSSRFLNILKMRRHVKRSDVDKFEVTTNNREPPAVTKISDAERSKRRARSIDKFARKGFPLSFFIFNLIYWISYAVPRN